MGKKKRMKIDGRTYKVTLDKFLADKKLRRKCIAKDGSCLFRAVSEQVYSSQCSHHEVRQKCAQYIEAHRDDFKEFITMPFEEYLERLRVKRSWGGELELVVLSRVYNRSIVVYNELGGPGGRSVEEKVFPSIQDEDKANCPVDELDNPIMLAYSDGNHYDSVYSTQYMDDTAFCQGLLYNHLMEKVFGDKIPHFCRKKLKQLHPSDLDSIAEFKRHKFPPSFNNKDPDARTFFNLGRFYAEDEVVAMSWTLHHNAALSLHRFERESFEQRDRSVAASIQFSVGNKCSTQIDGRRMTGEIVALNVKPGMHLVHVLHSHKSEKREIPIRNLTLLTPQSSANRKPQGGSALGSSGGGGGSGNGWKKAGPVSESVSETLPTSQSFQAASSSFPSPAPYGSVKKGKASAPSHTEGTQRDSQDPSKRKKVTGEQQASPNPESAPQQAKTASNSRMVTPAKGELRKGVLAAASAPALPASSTISHSTSTEATKMTPYSSIVKKTAGGPSGSLTSEGTEYDESSAEEDVQEEENEDVGLVPKFPRQQQQQKLQQQAKGHGQYVEDSPSSSGHGDVSSVEPGSPQQEIEIGKSPVAQPLQPLVQQSSPYFQRHIMSQTTSEPKDAWPSIHEDEKEVEMPNIALQQEIPSKTMIYAAVMSKQNRDPVSPTSSPTPFTYTATTTTASTTSPFPAAPFSSRHIVAAGMPSSASSMPQLPALYRQHQQPAQSIGISGMENLGSIPMLNSHPMTRVSATQNPSNHFQSIQPPQTSPAPLMSTTAYSSPHQRHTPQTCPPPAAMAPGNQGVFGGAGVTRGVIPSFQGTYTSSRSPRHGEGVALATTLPYSTVAAAMEMRNMLGIHGGGGVTRSSSSPLVYTESSTNAATTGYSSPASYPRPPPPPAPPVVVEKEVQVCPDVAAQSVQTTQPEKQDSPAQTSGLYVPVEDLSPSREVDVNSLADRLNFVVEYSLQCLAVFSRATSTSSSELEASLQELLEDNQIQQLVNQASTVNSLSASQSEFLRSMGGSGERAGQAVPYPRGGQTPPPQPLAPPTGEAEVEGNEGMAPQQEQQHLQSPSLPPRIPMNFPPFMMPPPRPPFMVPHPPPPHGSMPPMYYPIMAHMPVPPMGYFPLMPPMMPRQVAPPPSPGSPNATYSPPDGAHPNLPVPDQVEPTDTEENMEPSHPANPHADVPSSEMVASLSYPLPPSHIPQPNFAEGPPPTAHTIPNSDTGSGSVAMQQVAEVSQQQQQQQHHEVKSLVQPTTQLPSQLPPHQQNIGQPSDAHQTNVGVATGADAAWPDPAAMATVGDVVSSPISTSAQMGKMSSPLHSKPPQQSTQPQHPSSLTAKTQKPLKASVKAASSSLVPPTSANVSKSAPAVVDSSNPGPGLPCRPLSTAGANGGSGGASGGGGDQQQSRHVSKHAYHNKTKSRTDGDGNQRRNTTKPKVGMYRSPGTARKDEPLEERPLGGASDGRNFTKKTTSRQSGGGGGGGWKNNRKRSATSDHTGTSTISGPSSNSRSNHDPNRTFSVQPHSRNNYGSALEVKQDTKDFRWSVPSPNDTLDPIHSSPHHTSTTLPMKAAEDESNTTEWPDFSELNDESSRKTFSYSLGRRRQQWGTAGGAEDKAYLPPTLSDKDCARLTPSPSPPPTLVQCIEQQGKGSLHKH